MYIYIYIYIYNILIKKQHKQSLINSRTFSGTNTYSDHRLLVTKTKPKENYTKHSYVTRCKKIKIAHFTSLKDKKYPFSLSSATRTENENKHDDTHKPACVV